MFAERIGPYEVTNILGEGAFGRVWGAVDSRLGRKVAIKALRSEVKGDEDVVVRFRSEARNLAGLNHPNITMLLDIYEYESSEMMIMEFVPGETLEKILGKRKKLSVPEALSVICQAVSGIAHAHTAGLIHRDIKLTNLMVSETGTVKVMDFGLSRVQGSLRQTKVGKAMGTPFYLSPEQCRGGEGDERSDQYSLAIVLFELLAGHPPFEADNDFDLMRAHLETPPPSLRKIVPQVPKAVANSIIRALSKEPADRFESIETFALALGVDSVRSTSPEILLNILESSEGLSTDFEQSNTDHLQKDETLRERVLTVLLTLVIMLICGGGAYYLFGLYSPKNLIPTPSDQADLKGPITGIVSGNAVSVNSVTANLYGVIDKAKSYEDVVAAQNILRKVLPSSVVCYSKPNQKYECYDSKSPHKNIALIAIEQDLVRAENDIPETIYREAEQKRLQRR